MLVPVKQHFPLRLTTLQTKSFSLEAMVQVSPVLFPKLMFLNTATASTFDVKVKTSFYVGPSSDPLLTANYQITTTNVVLAAGARLVVPLDTVAVDGIIDLHTVEVKNNGLATEIIHCWFEGLYEESLRIPPTFPPTIL
jgi:hypothetical protein